MTARRGPERIGPEPIVGVGQLYLVQHQEAAEPVSWWRADPSFKHEKTEIVEHAGEFKLVELYSQLRRKVDLTLELDSPFAEGSDMEYFCRFYDLVSGKTEIIHWAENDSDNKKKIPEWLTGAVVDIQEWIHAEEAIIIDQGFEYDLPRNIVFIEYFFPDYAREYNYTNTGSEDAEALLGTIAAHLTTAYRNSPSSAGS